MAVTKKSNSSYLDKLEEDVKSNQSTLSMVLGALIILVLGVLLFNYFNRNKGDIATPSSTNTETSDVTPENLPGKYTVKEGDTLFMIADRYYKDGYKFTEIATANKLDNVNTITTGQVLDIPKLEVAAASSSPEAVANASASPEATEVATASTPPATGGDNSTIWGPKIEADTYTVIEGDWLSTISARAYNDIQAYDKIAKANNIANPDLITPGMVLKLPR